VLLASLRRSSDACACYRVGIGSRAFRDERRGASGSDAEGDAGVSPESKNNTGLILADNSKAAQEQNQQRTGNKFPIEVVYSPQCSPGTCGKVI